MTNSNLTLHVRLALVDEAADIATVLRLAFADYEALYTREALAATTPTAEQLQQRWAEGPVWVAVQAGQLVGTVAAVVKGESLYVRSLASLPVARGLRLGARLLEPVEQFASALGLQRIFLSTTPFLHHAIRFYEQHGFQRTGVGPHPLFGTPLFTMEKWLAHPR